MDAPEKTWVWLARIRRPQGRKGEVFAEVLTDFPEKFEERRHLWLLPDDSVSAGGASLAGVTSSSDAGKGGRQVHPRASQSAELVHHWKHKDGIVLHFAGINTITDAEGLTGWIVAVPREQRAPLADDEVYIGDLIGCTVVDVAQPNEPRLVGTVENVEREAGPVPLLMVRSEAGEILVPFAKNFLRRLDLEGRRMEMDLPAGLVDLNP